jgi:hypothetical protein
MTAFTVPSHLFYAIDLVFFRETDSQNNLSVVFAGAWSVVIAYRG